MSVALDLGPHGAFIWASYAVFFIVLAGFAAWIAADEAYQQRLLAELEAQGMRRRSAAKPAAGGTGPGATGPKRPPKPKTRK